MYDNLIGISLALSIARSVRRMTMSTINLFKNSISTLSLGAFLTLGFYNAMIVNSDSFMHDVSDIKFAKRLDEIHGRVEFGRMAASDSEWQNLGLVKQEVKVVENKIVKQTQLLKKKVDILKNKESEFKELPPPAINADLDMSVTNVFFKGPIDASKVSGSARTVNGVIEEIYIELPNNEIIDIQTRDRMVGNVFKYEDTETRELRSGMFYEVKKGTYMITLTNDSRYPGLRVEFVAQNEEAVAYNESFYENVNFNGFTKEN